MPAFTLQPLKNPGLIQKILGRKPKINAITEINNLFARSQDNLRQVSLEQVIHITGRYKVNLSSRFKEERMGLFQSYLHACLENNKLDQQEVEDLKHLRSLLMLKEKDTREQIRRATARLYEKHLRDTLSNGELSPKERDMLEQLKKDLLLSHKMAEKLYKRNANKVLEDYIRGAISDERLSPEEEEQMNELAGQLGLEPGLDANTRESLEKYKLYWLIENGDLPVIHPDIRIQKSENMYFKTHIHWQEQRKVKKRINYGGPTARIRLAKGVYYRAGSIRMQGESTDEWRKIDKGYLYLTNKRLIFMGEKGNKVVRFNRILDIIPFQNGVHIQKDTGKSPFLEFSDKVDIFSMTLVRLMDDME